MLKPRIVFEYKVPQSSREKRIFQKSVRFKSSKGPAEVPSQMITKPKKKDSPGNTDQLLDDKNTYDPSITPSYDNNSPISQLWSARHSPPWPLFGLKPHKYTIKEFNADLIDDIFFHRTLTSNRQPFIFGKLAQRPEPYKIPKFKYRHIQPPIENSLWLKSLLRQQVYHEMYMIPSHLLRNMVPFQPLSPHIRKLWGAKIRVNPGVD